MSEPFVGQIGTFAFTFAPQDWLSCDGSLVSLQQYQVLFAVIGNAFGGSYPNNFQLPDLRGFAISGPGAGDAGYTAVYARAVGHETNNITGANLPLHTHDFNALNVPGDPTGAPDAVGKLPAQGFYSAGLPATRGRNVYAAASATPAVNMAPTMVQPAGTTNPPASQTAVSNRQPYLPINLCICTYGNFPMRT